MKNMFKALAVAAAFVLPGVASAQIDNSVTVNVVSFPYPTKGTGFDGFGGGFAADFAIDYPTVTKTFDDYLVWCIDPNRGVDVPGGPYSYTAWTAVDFAGSTLGSTKPSDLTLGQMRSIVSLVSTLQTGWDGFSGVQRENLQGQIWSTFRGESPDLAGSENVSLTDWVVLYGNNGNQTFLTYVPEPSGAVLLLVGFAGMVVIASARRRQA
jgi:hypothetical protein